MSQITRELPLNEDVTLRVVIENYYIIKDVSLIFQKIINDKLIETRYKIQAPYHRFDPLIEMCKKKGFESGRL